MKEIQHTLNAMSVSEKYQVEEFSEGDEVIFEAVFPRYPDKSSIKFYRDPTIFSYSLEITAGSGDVSGNLTEPEIDFADPSKEKIKVSWLWNTNGMRPGSYDAKAVIIGPEMGKEPAATTLAKPRRAL